MAKSCIEPGFIKLQIERSLSKYDLISSKASVEFTIFDHLMDMTTNLRMAIVEKSPALDTEEDTLP